MALEDCIKIVCEEADVTQESLTNIRIEARKLLNDVAKDSSVFDCVINGTVGQYCTTSNNVAHLTIAEALARLNNMPGIGAVNGESFTATAGQTVFTLSAAVPNPAALEVEVNGALCQTPRDWNVAGTTLTFTQPLIAGDQVDIRLFVV